MKVARLLVCILGFTASAAMAQPLPPTWECLPDDTVMAVRVPGGLATMLHLSRTTRYGRMQFNATRFRAFADQLPAAADDPSQSIMRLFDEAGLLDNWPALLRGEAGTAYIYDRTAADSDTHPFFQVTWFEPDAQLAAAVMAALEAAARRPEHPAIVTKLTLADREVLHLALPMVTDLHGWPGPFEPGERLFVPDYGHVLATRIGDRILIAQIDPPAPLATEGERIAGIEPVVRTAPEWFPKQFAALLEAHEQSRNPITHRVDPVSDQLAALPGTIALELMLDLRYLFEEDEPDDDGAEPSGYAAILQAMGLRQVGALIVRVTVDDRRVDAAVGLSLPEPRSNAAALLDETPLPAVPPDWLPADVVEYSRLAIDLGKAFSVLRTFVEEFETADPEQFAALDLLAQQIEEEDMAGLLSALGRDHTVVRFAAPQGEEPPAALMLAVQGDDWRRRFAAIGRWLAAQGEVRAVRHAGFVGYLPTEDPRGGLFLGHGLLIGAGGEGMPQRILDPIAQPLPPGERFTASDLYRQATTLLQPHPTLATSIATHGRYPHAALRWIRDTVLSGTPEAVADLLVIDEPFNDEGEPLFLPSTVETSTVQIHATPQGLTAHTAAVLQAQNAP